LRIGRVNESNAPSVNRTDGMGVFRALPTAGGSATAPGQGYLSGKAGRIALLFIAGVIYAVLIAPFHHNDGCLLDTDCPLSKFVTDFSSCVNSDSQALAEPRFISASFIPESQTCIFGICPAILTTRAPPISPHSIDA